MISLVVVSHSRPLARAAVELARQMVDDGCGPCVEVAAGLERLRDRFGVRRREVGEGRVAAELGLDRVLDRAAGGEQVGVGLPLGVDPFE